MKTKLLLIISILFFLTGCKHKNNKLFTNKSVFYDNNIDVYSKDDEFDFFAKDLILISENENLNKDLINSSSSLLINLNEKKAEYSNNVYEKLYPSSLTKLVTALLVLNRGELTDTVTISYNAANNLDSTAKSCGFKEGDLVSLETLLNCALVYSGNDACVAIAEHLAQDEVEFANLMNDEIKKLGALKSNFTNSHGLHDDNQYTSAYDIYLIFNDLLKSDIFLSIINQKSYTAKYQDKDGNEIEKTFQTINGYIDGSYTCNETLQVVGGKVGYTRKSGSCMVLLSKTSSNISYISIILKAENNDLIYREMNNLLDLIK